MKLLLLLFLLPSLLFTPDATDEKVSIKEMEHGIFKMKPQQEVNIPHADKQVYNLISNAHVNDIMESN